MGYVVQGGGLFPHLTARENVELLAQLREWDAGRIEARISELARLARIDVELLGVDDRVGSLEVVKDGDLVLWSGPTPFEPTSRLIGVLVDGVLKLDPRAN